MGDRCTGHCCRRLPLMFSPTELQDHVEFERAYLVKEADPAAPTPKYCHWPDGTERERYYDIEQIAGMLEYLGPSLPEPGEPVSRNNFTHHYYRCKNLQPNGDCGIYDTRPGMCRDYPYDRACEIEGCTWDAVCAKTQKTADDEPKKACMQRGVTLAESFARHLLDQ